MGAEEIQHILIYIIKKKKGTKPNRRFGNQLIGHGLGVFVSKIGFNKRIQLTIHYRDNISGLIPSPHIFDQLVRVEHIVPYLLPPIRLHRVSPYLLYLTRPLLHRNHQQLRLQTAQCFDLVRKL